MTSNAVSNGKLETSLPIYRGLASQPGQERTMTSPMYLLTGKEGVSDRELRSAPDISVSAPDISGTSSSSSPDDPEYLSSDDEESDDDVDDDVENDLRSKSFAIYARIQKELERRRNREGDSDDEYR